MKPKLFVGSSREQIVVARAVHEELDADAEVTVWDQGVFELTKTALESLLEELANSDFTVFVLTPEDIARIRNVEYQVVRDNIIFELGLALGTLGRERSFMIQPKLETPVHLPTDLLGVTVAFYDPIRVDGRMRSAVAPACNRLRRAMQSVGDRRRATNVTLRVGISGSMSVGKKTLASALSNELNGRPYIEQVVLFQDVGRQMISAGRTADRATEFGDYAAYFQRHLANINGRPVGCMLHVRTLFDTIAYAEVNGNFTGEWMSMAREMARLCAEKFDTYFYVPIESCVSIVNDGVRSTDPKYREQIDAAIGRVLREFMPSYVQVNGTVQQRVTTALAAIDSACRRAHT
jgi:nicotinamide riboside kinase